MATTNPADAIREEIARIDAILSSGVSSVSVNGTTTNFDLTSLRLRKRELQAQLSRFSANEAMRRPVAFSFDMGGGGW